LILLVACSSVGEQATRVNAAAPEIELTESASTTLIDKGDLVGWELTPVSVGQEILLVAVADDPDEMARGLMGVEDFGDVDGMLFAFEEESFTGFWMKDSPVPLDIAFFDHEGILVDAFTMEPCEADPCPVYMASGPFAWALETPAGLLGELSSDVRLDMDNG
jgi:uncharacterized membrane protein (UPF0127 family)